MLYALLHKSGELLQAVALLVTAAKATRARDGSKKRLVKIFVLDIMVAKQNASVDEWYSALEVRYLMDVIQVSESSFRFCLVSEKFRCLVDVRSREAKWKEGSEQKGRPGGKHF